MVLFLLLAVAQIAGCSAEEPGAIRGAERPPRVTGQSVERQRAVLDVFRADESSPAKQILFGDLHVHTTYSVDAFEAALPFMGGEGVRPPADACDFARYCSQLDFWSINDHAEFLTPDQWDETAQTIRQCNSIAGEPDNPDMVSFLGYEWTQIGATPANHYGHKNVLIKETAEGAIPARPIRAGSGLESTFNVELRARDALVDMVKRPFYDPLNASLYLRYLRQTTAGATLAPCEWDEAGELLDPECSETANTPAELFAKLDAWGGEALVIPHGTSWGLYTPAGSSWNKQLEGAMHDPDRQRLIEVYSGHGNSEEYRSWQDLGYDAAGNPVCPEPVPGYEPCCWRAGELVRAGAGCVDPDSQECAEAVAEARQNYVVGGASGHLTIPGARIEDWGACGQCEDCFLPAFKLRPGTSAQAALALRGEGDEGERFRFGFIASSDNHSARPGTGYKELARTSMTDVRGPISKAWERRTFSKGVEGDPSVSVSPAEIRANSYRIFERERRASYLYTGGLVAVHSPGRDRDSIWLALQRKEVYGTSGPRIFLWFDLLRDGVPPAPMGSELTMREAPRFRVRAAGSLKQKPGCPEFAYAGLSEERIGQICRGECYFPSDERHRVTRIEVVRIRPQAHGSEPLDGLIEDPWLVLPCTGKGDTCEVSFEDPEFEGAGRDAVYYVRAMQEATPAINGAGMRCVKYVNGTCREVTACSGGYRHPAEDDCLADVEERAWSSPIFIDFGGDG